MTRTAPHRARARDAAMTIKVYTVTQEGVVTAPRTTVTVTRSYTDQPAPMSTVLPPCACPQHRKGEEAR